MMRKANVFVNNQLAGEFLETEKNKSYRFTYNPGYKGGPISLQIPLSKQIYEFDRFPPFFEGLLPEGIMLAGLLKRAKIDSNDFFAQLMEVGADMVGYVTVEEQK